MASGSGSRFPSWPLPVGFALAILGFLFYPPVQSHPRLMATLVGVSAFLLIWNGLLVLRAHRRGERLRIEPVTVRAHWVQAAVQFSIYVFWGWYSRTVYTEAPLIVAQIAYLYAFDCLLSWSRGRAWRIGFGPLPVILSTNLLLWFKPDWYFLQFAMVTIGALGKEFIRWERDGKRSHIFNPSVFGQGLIALALIATGTTTRFTYGEEIALAFESLATRHMHLVLFLLGLVVQYLFSVTLITIAATAWIAILGLAFTAYTGTYYFITLNVGTTIFLGLHLLVTDPSTSPRTNVGKVIFGSLYGIGYFALNGLLDALGVPLFWDKLLPVPILNLCVPLIDRVARSGAIGRLDERWRTRYAPARMNLVHMAVWAALFFTLLGTGYIGAGDHPGRSLAFWKKAYAEHRFHAGKKLLVLVNQRAPRGNGEALNILGLLHLEGKLVAKSPFAAAECFARACEAGHYMGCENAVRQFLYTDRVDSEITIAHALDRLEAEAAKGTDGIACFLVGFAYEFGLIRPFDVNRALELYEKGAAAGNADAGKGLARIRNIPAPATGAPDHLHHTKPDRHAIEAAAAERRTRFLLQRAAKAGDPTSDGETK